MRNTDDYWDNEHNIPLHIAARHKRYQRDLIQHPNCNDPDHPGCEHCDEDHPDYIEDH
jgi:hypothetical protein